MNTREKRAGRARWFLLRHSEKISASAIGLVFGAFLGAGLILPFGTLSEPGPGLWPTSVALMGLLFVVFLFVLGKDTPILAQDQRGHRLFLFLAAIVLYAPLYSIIGFVPSSVVVLFVLIKLAGGFGWLLSVVCSIMGATAVYAVFGIGLDLPIDAF